MDCGVTCLLKQLLCGMDMGNWHHNETRNIKTRELSLHVCGQILEDLLFLRESERPNLIQKTHKEEAQGIISAD